MTRRHLDLIALAPLHEDWEGKEWLVANGLGGYGSGPLIGLPTRRFHGWLIAALPAPLGRSNMLQHLDIQVEVGSSRLALDSALIELRLELGLPVWRYRHADFILEKRVVLLHQQNTCHVIFELIESSAPLTLLLSPAVDFRPHEGPVAGPSVTYALTSRGDRHELLGPPAYPPLRLWLAGRVLGHDPAPGRILVDYAVERARGYDHQGWLHVPGTFALGLEPGERATLVASTEPWEHIANLGPDEALLAETRRRELLIARSGCPQHGVHAELVLAADQFIIFPASRVEDASRAHASGHEARTVIAGYHWFTEWGRDTMISLEGLALCTRRYDVAADILRTFAHYVKDGLIPNLIPEGQHGGLYHTADASLWFFHAIARYLVHTADDSLLLELLPALRQIADAHLAGTRFGIGVDPEDGLLSQGAPGYQLTWMDAKVGDWVVTPRRGKAVEINALFYNAMCLLAGWLPAAEATPYRRAAERVHEAFNRRFWYDEGGYCYDVIDGETAAVDPACRPNQLLAIGLQHAVLDPARWPRVLEVCRDKLLTPVGLRSLSPDHPDYKPRYFGDLRARDAAYHQGTVWAWLIGPYADAWRRAYPRDGAGLREALVGLTHHLDQACIGQVSEIFDAERPYAPRGCVAQAWSVAEMLRVLGAIERDDAE
jgi:predicted glycogen debranching enzyme